MPRVSRITTLYQPKISVLRAAVAFCWNCDRADPGDASAARHVVEITRTGGAALLPARVRQGGTPEGAEVAGKKRPKSQAQTEKKTPNKPKRPKKTSRGK